MAKQHKKKNKICYLNYIYMSVPLPQWIHWAWTTVPTCKQICTLSCPPLEAIDMHPWSHILCISFFPSFFPCPTSVSPDVADGYKAFLRSVRDALCGRGLISTDHNSRTHCVQAGDPEGQGATLQILAAHEPGTELTHKYTDVQQSEAPFQSRVGKGPHYNHHKWKKP